MSKGKLYFTVGLPRSGKSTYCNNFVRIYDKVAVAKPRTIVCQDDIRIALGTVYNRWLEPLVYSTAQTMTRSLLHRGFDVIIDETNTSLFSLVRIFDIDNQAAPVVFRTSQTVCEQRARDSDRDYLLPVIARLAPQLDRLLTYGIERIHKEYLDGTIHNRFGV